MAIYDKDGLELGMAFAPSGAELPSAFDADGVQVYTNIHNLKVMTYNVGSWYDGLHDNVPAEKDADYYALQKGIITRHNPDILFMNEYVQQFSKAGRTALSFLQECGFTYIHEQGGATTTVTNGRCIASKYPLSNYTVRNFNDGSTYYYDTCTVTVGGVPISLMVTHLHWNDRSKRESELSTIMGVLSGFTRFIFAGDFNTTDCYDTTGLDYTAIIAPLINAGYNVANCGEFGFITTYYDQPTHGDYTGVLDNIVTSANIEITSVTRDETKLNDGLEDHIDHLPLIATLEF